MRYKTVITTCFTIAAICLYFLISGCASTAKVNPIQSSIENMLGRDRDFDRVCEMQTDPMHLLCIVSTERDVPQKIKGQLLPASTKLLFLTDMAGNKKLLSATVTSSGYHKNGEYHIDWPAAYWHEVDHVRHAMGHWYNPDKRHTAMTRFSDGMTTSNVLWR